MAKLRMPIDAHVLFRMYEYAAFAKAIHGSEIAGYGHYNEEDGVYKLAPLTKQIVTGGDVDAFPSAIINDTAYDISDMLVQWHSHVEMGTFFSGQDKKNIIDMLGLYPFLISIVVNCKHEYTARVDIRNIAYGNGGKFRLPESEIITYDLELIPYYSNNEVYDEVSEKLRRPRKKPVRRARVIPITQTPAQQTPAGKPTSASELPSLFSDEELLDLYHKGAFDTDVDSEYMEFVPKNSAILNDVLGWYESTVLLAGALVAENLNEGFSAMRIEQTGSVFINHQKSRTYCTIDQTGVQVGGEKATWKKFLQKCGGNFARDYEYTLANVERCRKKYIKTEAKNN